MLNNDNSKTDLDIVTSSTKQQYNRVLVLSPPQTDREAEQREWSEVRGSA